MIAGGVSLKGSYHKDNQDRFWAFSDMSITAIAVSDGLGSCERSAIGAQAFCDSARDTFLEHDLPCSNPEELCLQLHMKWLQKLDGNHVEDCFATALFAVLRDGLLTMASLGDGFIAAILDDGTSIVLMDEKENHFANETDCLQESFESSHWRVCCIPCNSLTGLVASTDGMELYPEDKESISLFVKSFCDSYKEMDSEQINEEICGWLGQWPGTDDKTIAYCL